MLTRAAENVPSLENVDVNVEMGETNRLSIAS